MHAKILKLSKKVYKANHKWYSLVHGYGYALRGVSLCLFLLILYPIFRAELATSKISKMLISFKIPSLSLSATMIILAIFVIITLLIGAINSLLFIGSNDIDFKTKPVLKDESKIEPVLKDESSDHSKTDSEEEARITKAKNRQKARVAEDISSACAYLRELTSCQILIIILVMCYMLLDVDAYVASGILACSAILGCSTSLYFVDDDDVLTVWQAFWTKG